MCSVFHKSVAFSNLHLNESPVKKAPVRASTDTRWQKCDIYTCFRRNREPLFRTESIAVALKIQFCDNTEQTKHVFLLPLSIFISLSHTNMKENDITHTHVKTAKFEVDLSIKV